MWEEPLCNIQVKDIMSSPIVAIDYSKSAKEAIDFMTSNTFTATCLSKDGKPIDSFVTLRRLKDSENASDIRAASMPIDSRFKIDASASVLDAIEKLAENMKSEVDTKFLFCTSDGSLGGIMTSADLNKPEVNACIMAEIIAFESLLNKMIVKRIPDWESKFRTSKSSKPKTDHDWEARYLEAKRTDVALDLIHYLDLMHKFCLVKKDPVLGSLIFSTTHKEIHTINGLRNTVAHAKDLFAPKRYNLVKDMQQLRDSVKVLEQLSQKIQHNITAG